MRFRVFTIHNNHIYWSTYSIKQFHKKPFVFVCNPQVFDLDNHRLLSRTALLLIPQSVMSSIDFLPNSLFMCFISRRYRAFNCIFTISRIHSLASTTRKPSNRPPPIPSLHNTQSIHSNNKRISILFTFFSSLLDPLLYPII